MKLSPLIQGEVQRLQRRIDVAHRRIGRDKNVDDEAEVIDRLTPVVEAMKKTGKLQEFIDRPVAGKKAQPKAKAQNKKNK